MVELFLNGVILNFNIFISDTDSLAVRMIDDLDEIVKTEKNFEWPEIKKNGLLQTSMMHEILDTLVE